MNCTVPRTVHTIGHSTRGIEDFTAHLKAHAVTLVVDVRRWPASRRYPHFCREALSESLRNESIDYVWREDLGGFRKPSPNSENTAWKVDAFRGYADFMLTPEFKKIMHEMEPLTDGFLVRGFSMRHIMNDGCQEHHFAVIRDAKRYRNRLSRFAATPAWETILAF